MERERENFFLSDVLWHGITFSSEKRIRAHITRRKILGKGHLRELWRRKFRSYATWAAKNTVLMRFCSILCFSGHRDSWRHKIFHGGFSIKQDPAKIGSYSLCRETIECNIICGHMSLIIFRETILTASDATSRGREAARLSTTCLFHAARGCHKLQIQEGRKKLVR